jgi:hypothetical protein
MTAGGVASQATPRPTNGGTPLQGYRQEHQCERGADPPAKRGQPGVFPFSPRYDMWELPLVANNP